MSKLNDLREQRQKAIADARRVKDAADNAKREMTAEEVKTFDQHFADADKLEASIKREERVLEAERETASQTEVEDKARRGTPEYKDAQIMRGLRAAFAGQAHDITPEYRALQAGTDSAGGYLVLPEKYISQLIKAVDNETFIRQKATKHSVPDASSLGAPYLAADPADADWTTELLIGSEDSTMAFGKRSLTPHPMAKSIKVSEKLLRASSIGAESLVMQRLAYKFGVTEEKGFMTGSGALQPLGVFTASNDGISTGRDYSTGNATDSPTFDGLIGAKYNLKSQYQKRAEWIFHRDCVAKIAKLKDGNGQYIWQASKQVGDPDRLLGLAVNMSEYAPATFTTGLYVGILGDFSNYWIADALSMRFQRLVELYAATNQVGFIGRLEVDGMPVLEEAFSRVKLG